MTNSCPFLILGLPRSRTAWLSKFLTYNGWICGHEELQRMKTLKDIKTWFTQPQVGTVETAAAPWWRLIPVLVPDCKVVCVRRPVNEVVKSLMTLCPGVFDEVTLTRGMTYLDHKLGQLTKRLPNVLTVTFDDLNRKETCKQVFEFCLNQPFDEEHYNNLKDKNIQIDFFAMVRYATAYKESLVKLAQQATNKVKTQLALKRNKVIPPDGVTIQRESFDVFVRDGQQLFEQHCTEVGEPIDQWKRKNLGLMKYLDDNGLLQVMVARSNGRMFGYLMTLIAPSLVDTAITSATHSTFYADPTFPGLGLKLQRAANASLQLGGVDEVFMQTGTRGDGDRLGVIYERIGAEPVGNLYRLDLKKAI